MRKISAHYIYPGNTSPIKNGVVVVANDGTINALLDPKKTEINWEDVEKYDGIICPGFVNTHCHLELSYLKGKIAPSTQLHGFVRAVVALRHQFSEQDRTEAMRLAEQEMIANGIVAVGDISNGNESFQLKEKSNLKYHTFIEVFGADPTRAATIFNKAAQLFHSYFDQQRASITPHATYSVSDQLSQLIDHHATLHQQPISYHNQETQSENTLFKTGKGEMFDFLNVVANAKHQFVPTGKNALPSFLKRWNPQHKILLVHNTFTEKEDIAWAKKYADKVYWCFCPNANEYIENTQPNYSIFSHEKCTIGTDSLASNYGLSILEELKTITKKNPAISLETLIKWATYNGASFLNFNTLGSIEKGRKPNLNLITNIVSQKLSVNSEVKILV